MIKLHWICWFSLFLFGYPFSVDAQQGQSSDFPKPVNTQKVKDRVTSAEDVAANARVPDGFRVSVFAAEPHVQNPIAITTDHRGRVWIAENYTYAVPEKSFDLRFRDRIIILDDKDHDGRFDKRIVFWDQGKRLSSVEIGFGGVWALCPPQLLFIPDRDQDDRPDGPPQVILDGWDDGVVRHNMVNGLKWGPDGWLYGRHGIQATSLVGPPGATASQRTPMNCGIWRYHPTRKVFEVVCHGTTNPWGFDYDDHGQMFFINTVIGHLWHIVPGAHYKRMYGADFNPYVYRLIDQTADHFHWDTKEGWNDIRHGVTDTTSRAGGGHAHSGLMIYLGDNWPSRYRNSLFTVNLHGLRINHDRLERHGSGYEGIHQKDFAFFNDSWFRGIELTYGPDGGVFVIDWADIGECHENDGVHRTSGRIYKLTFGTPKNPGSIDLSNKSDRELVQLQLHKNDWFVRQSRRLLQQRAATEQSEDIHAALRGIFRQSNEVRRRLRAIWCLYVTGGADENWLVEQLKDREEHIRVWAVRLLADGPSVSDSAARALAKMAPGESSGLVRLFLASSMQRMTKAQAEYAWALAESLAVRQEDAGDRAAPLMMWYGTEPLVMQNTNRAIKLACTSRIPLLRRCIARRIAGEIENHSDAVRMLVQALDNADRPKGRDILQGMIEAFRGWRKAPAPENWVKVSQSLAKESPPELGPMIQELSVVFGDGRAVDQFKEIVTSQTADPDSRRNALRALIQSGRKDVASLLLRLVSDRVLAVHAVHGLASFDHPRTADVVLKNYYRFSPEERDAAIATLSSRASYAKALLKAVEDGEVARRQITAYHARQMRSFRDSALQSELDRLWGPVRTTSGEKRERITALKKQLSADRLAKADLALGRKVFQKTCGNCHVLFGEGGRIGPDLTGANRKNIDYLLENIVDPSATMIQDYRVSVVHLKNGRILTGVVVRKTSNSVELQTEKEKVFLRPDDIAEQVLQNVSLMPDGLLKPLSEQEVAAMIAYVVQ